jgi:hypothetical protein
VGPQKGNGAGRLPQELLNCILFIAETNKKPAIKAGFLFAREINPLPAGPEKNSCPDRAADVIIKYNTLPMTGGLG